MWPRFGLKNPLKVAAFKAEINSLLYFVLVPRAHAAAIFAL